jgi:hypothetical protein
MRTKTELQKEINGKQVIWVEGIIRMDAIFIWPPKGNQVSVKPYGYTPEEVVKMLEEGGYSGYSEYEVAKPRFCVSSIKTDKDDLFEVIERLADIPINGEYTFEAISKGFEKRASGRHDENSMFDVNPICPYG